MYFERIFLFHFGCQFTGSEFGVPVRLANGTSSSEGRVEIYFQDRLNGMCKECSDSPKFATYKAPISFLIGWGNNKWLIVKNSFHLTTYSVF